MARIVGQVSFTRPRGIPYSIAGCSTLGHQVIWNKYVPLFPETNGHTCWHHVSHVRLEASILKQKQTCYQVVPTWWRAGICNWCCATSEGCRRGHWVLVWVCVIAYWWGYHIIIPFEKIVGQPGWKPICFLKASSYFNDYVVLHPPRKLGKTKYIQSRAGWHGWTTPTMQTEIFSDSSICQSLCRGCRAWLTNLILTKSASNSSRCMTPMSSYNISGKLVACRRLLLSSGCYVLACSVLFWS